MKKRAFPAVILALLLAGCGGVYKPFELMDDRAQMKPGTLAVIAGDTSEPTPLIAQALTKQLKERSTFRVLSQDEVARRLGKYPASIKRTDPENEDRPVWYAKGEKAKIDALQGEGQGRLSLHCLDGTPEQGRNAELAGRLVGLI